MQNRHLLFALRSTIERSVKRKCRLRILCTSISHVRRWHTVLPPLFNLRNPVTSRSSVLVLTTSPNSTLPYVYYSTPRKLSGSGSVHVLTWRKYQNACVHFRSVGLIFWVRRCCLGPRCLLRQRAVEEEPCQRDCHRMFYHIRRLRQIRHYTLAEKSWNSWRRHSFSLAWTTATPFSSAFPCRYWCHFRHLEYSSPCYSYHRL